MAPCRGARATHSTQAPPTHRNPTNPQTSAHLSARGLQHQQRSPFQTDGTGLQPFWDDKCPDLSEHAPADNGGWTFLSTNPESKRGLESPRSVPPASSANGAPHTSLGQRPRSRTRQSSKPCRGAPFSTDGTGLQPFADNRIPDIFPQCCTTNGRSAREPGWPRLPQVDRSPGGSP
jgi:hypothetical protein